MIPLGDTTAILPRVQRNGAKNRGFSLTIVQPREQLSPFCISSPIHSTPSPVLRRVYSRTQRRISSVSSLCRPTKVQGEQEVPKQRSQEDLRTVCDSENRQCMEKKQLVSPQQIHENRLITSTSQKERISSLVMKDQQSTAGSSTTSSPEDLINTCTPKSFETKNRPKVKTRKSHSKTAKSSSKNKSRKTSKSKKPSKRRHSFKSTSRVPSVFERLTNSTVKNVNNKEKVNDPSSTKKETTIFYNNRPCGSLLAIKKLQATYNPKQNTKPRTFLLLPKVPRLINIEKNSPRITVKQETENVKLNNSNSMVNSPRRKSLDMSFKDNNNVCKKVYLSEMQSKLVCGVPSAPPGTPSPDQLKRVEYIPSLMDVKSQRAVKSKLEKIVHKLRLEEQHRKEISIRQDQKKLKEALIQLKQRQRAEIYALNKVMTELENENFDRFMDNKEAVCLGV